MIKLLHGDTELALYEPLDAARYLDITQQTLNVWRRSGFIRATPMGRGYVYTKDSLDETLHLKRPHLFMNQNNT